MVIKIITAIIFALLLTACGKYPSKSQALNALVHETKYNFNENTELDDFECTGDKPVTCTYEVGGVKHEDRFTTTGDGLWVYFD